MGLPLSRFEMMAGLCSREAYIVDTFSRFKVICLILHDPYDERFKNKIRRCFNLLYHETGKDMLFITMVDIPDIERRVLFAKSSDDRIKLNLASEREIDDRLMLNCFIRSAAPDTQLPAIVVTTDLLSDEYAVLDTSEAGFENQLIEIGHFCSRSIDRFPVSDPRFFDLLQYIGPCQLVQGSRSLSEQFADVLALKRNTYRRYSKQWADKRLDELRIEMEKSPGDREACIAYYNYKIGVDKAKRAEMSNLEDAGDIIFNQGLPDMYEHGDPSKRPIREGEGVSFYRQYKINTDSIDGFENCEALSKCDIEQFNSQLRFFIKGKNPALDTIMYTDRARQCIRSFMPLSIFLSVFLEREINLSLVQMMRQGFGIEMPEYFCRFKRDCKAVVRGKKGFEVGLNKCKYPDKWVPLMFGEAYYAYKTLCDPNGEKEQPHFEPIGDNFLSLWNNLLDVRNSAGHAQYEPEDIVDYVKFQSQYSSFMAMVNSYLKKLMDIKSLMKGAPDHIDLICHHSPIG